MPVIAPELETETVIGEGPDPEIEIEIEIGTEIGTGIEMVTEEAEGAEVHGTTGTGEGTTEDLEVTQEAETGTDPGPTTEEATDMIETGVMIPEGIDPTEMTTELVEIGTETIGERVDETGIKEEEQAGPSLGATREQAIDQGLDLETGTTRETTGMGLHMTDQYQQIEGPDPTKDAQDLMKEGPKSLTESRMTSKKSPTTSPFQEVALIEVEMEITSQNRLIPMELIQSLKLRCRMKLLVKMLNIFHKSDRIEILFNFSMAMKNLITFNPKMNLTKFN